MDLFELLFIALFILFPILDGVLRRKKEPGAGMPGEETGADSDPFEPDFGGDPFEPDRSESRPADREPVRAADMVPDDLWTVLTGEERALEEESDAAWEGAPEPLLWRDEEEDEEPEPEPVSREYRGPEAYSLEHRETEVVSLEQPLASPEVRHRRFHERLERVRPRAPKPRSALGRALRTPEGLRQAFVLSEVLGPPRGLE